MALIREEARKSEEEQRKLDAEARRAEESLREANELLEKKRQDAFKRLCDQNDMKEKINQLEVQTKKELQDMEEKMQKERQEMQEKMDKYNILIDVKEEMPSEDEDLFNFTMFFPTIFQFLISLWFVLAVSGLFCFQIIKLIWCICHVFLLQWFSFFWYFFLNCPGDESWKASEEWK